MKISNKLIKKLIKESIAKNLIQEDVPLRDLFAGGRIPGGQNLAALPAHFKGKPHHTYTGTLTLSSAFVIIGILMVRSRMHHYLPNR